MLSFGMSVPLFPYMIMKSNTISEAEIEIFSGILFSSYAVGVLFASIIFSYFSDRFSVRKPYMISAAVILEISLIVFSIGGSIPILIFSRFLHGIASGESWVIGFAIIADRFTGDEAGSTMGLVLSGSTMGYLLGPVLSGLLFDATGGIFIPMLLNSVIVFIDFLCRILIFVPVERILSKDMKMKVMMTELGFSRNKIVEADDEEDSDDEDHRQSKFDISEEKPKKRVDFMDIVKEPAMVICLVNIFIYSVLAFFRIHSVCLFIFLVQGVTFQYWFILLFIKLS